MKRLTLLLVFFFPLLHSSAQWTVPKLIDSSGTIVWSAPKVSIGPDRELMIAYWDGGRFLCYKSTDLGNTFSRIVVDTARVYGWYSLGAGVPASLGFHGSSLFTLARYSDIDETVCFVSYGIKRLRPDSTEFRSMWFSGAVNNGLNSPFLDRPAMSILDSKVYVLMDTLPFRQISGDGWIRQKNLLEQERCRQCGGEQQ